jgi:hypothetical protein
MVAEAARWLDGKAPGWELKINPATLDLTDADACVLCQALGSFSLYVNKVPIDISWAFCGDGSVPSDWLTFGEGFASWRHAESLWIEEAKARLNA